MVVVYSATMTNEFSQIAGEDEFRNEITMGPNEFAADSMLEMEYEDRSGQGYEQEIDQPVDREDDFQDYNDNETFDYMDE
jgi:hypothetical protein